jgi:branched-chain amino acid transport system permease protein
MSALRTWLQSIAPIALAIPVLAVLQSVLATEPFALQLLLGVAVNVVLAVSLNILNGMTGQFSIGHAGFAAVGAFLSALFSKLTMDVFTGAVGAQVGFLLAIVVGASAAALCGFVVGLPSLRLKGDYLAIVTLGFGEIIRVIVRNTEVFGKALGMSGVPQHTTLFSAGMAVVVVVLVAKRVRDSGHGRALLAIREDEIAAEAMGVNTTGYKVRAFVIASFFAGVAGAIFAHYQSVVSSASFTYVKSMEIVVMVVAGGLGSTSGAILAAVVLTLLPEALRSLLLAITQDGGAAQLVEQIRMPVYGLILVALMLLRPQGLFGSREAWDLWKRKGAT